MTQAALKDYEEARKNQLTRNEARRIRTRVTEARQNPHPASVRWPFELLQNALDAGPRNGRRSVTVRLSQGAASFAFVHDGAPFTSTELAALLSGGSSKEFDSDETTGRFGTGFLVTHALAERTTLRAVLHVQSGYEEFSLTLDRSGDENAILENIHLCNEAIGAATPINLDEVDSARFEYPLADNHALLIGLQELERALPYLYGTLGSLGQVELASEGGSTTLWTPGEIVVEALDGGFVEHRSILVEHEGAALPGIQIYRFFGGDDRLASALVLVEQMAEHWKIRLTERGAPRIYREYPLRGSGFLPINLVLDGKFDPDQERARLLLSDRDVLYLKDAFRAAVLGVRYAFDKHWQDAHLLAQASPPTAAFDPTDEREKDLWLEQLSTFATALADLPIVECTSGFLPIASGSVPYADIIIPRLLLNSASDETTVERIWPLIEAATALLPPRRDLAVHWTDIARGWYELALTPPLFFSISLTT